MLQKSHRVYEGLWDTCLPWLTHSYTVSVSCQDPVMLCVYQLEWWWIVLICCCLMDPILCLLSLKARCLPDVNMTSYMQSQITWQQVKCQQNCTCKRQYHQPRGLCSYWPSACTFAVFHSSERRLPADAQWRGGCSWWAGCHGVYPSQGPPWAHHLMEKEWHPCQRSRREDHCELTHIYVCIVLLLHIQINYTQSSWSRFYGDRALR